MQPLRLILTATILAAYCLQTIRSDCLPPPALQELVESQNGNNVAVRAVLLDETQDVTCPVFVLLPNSTYADTDQGFGVFRVEEVFQGDILVGDEVSFLYSTDTGYRQQLPSALEQGAKSDNGVLLFLRRMVASCDEASLATDEMYYISECDYGNGVRLDWTWDSLPTGEKDYLRSLDGDGSSEGFLNRLIMSILCCFG